MLKLKPSHALYQIAFWLLICSIVTGTKLVKEDPSKEVSSVYHLIITLCWLMALVSWLAGVAVRNYGLDDTVVTNNKSDD